MALELGVVYSWPNIEPIIAGVPFIGIKGISFGAEREYKNIYGVSSEPIGRGSGRKVYKTAKVDIILDNWKQIIAVSPDGDPTKLAPFQIRLPFVPDPNNPNLPTTDTMQNCQFMSDGATYNEGDTAFWQSVDVIYAGQSR